MDNTTRTRFAALVREGKTLAAIRKIMGGLKEHSDSELIRMMIKELDSAQYTKSG